jgi:cysteine desulfurase/selenocysteine lyase
MALANEIEHFAAIRRQFPALERWTYMDVAGRGVLSRKVRDAIDAHLDDRMMNGATDKALWFATVERARARFAELIGADVDEIAFSKNVSDGLNMIAGAVDWQPGDNVVFCPGLEHPNNVYLWLNLRDRIGIELKTAAPVDGHYPIDQLLALIDDRTRVVTVSVISFSPGFKDDIERLGAECRKRGILFLVDAAQSVGILHTDVDMSNIDALCVSTQKGLLSLYGMGFVYCRRSWADRLRPLNLARFGVDLEGAHEASMGSWTGYKLAAGARRFDLGNYNFLGAAAVDASLEQLLDWDTRRIEKYVGRLSHLLARGFLDLGLPVIGGPPGPHLSKMVCVGKLEDNQAGAQEAFANGLFDYLTGEQVRFSIRRGLLRFSLHAYNDMDDVARVLELTRSYVRRTGR